MELKNKRITVAGAAGFIGTNIVEALVEHGASVKALIHNKNPQILNSKVEYLKVDLTKEEDCIQGTKNTDIFIMAAANTSGAAVMTNDPLVHLTTNIVMNSLTLDSCKKNNVEKYVFISSNTVYPVSENHMEENDVDGHFFDKYKIVGEMKWFSEKMVKMYCEVANTNLKGLVVRPGNLYGPFDKFNEYEAKVIPSLISRALRKEDPFLVWGDGKDIKDFLYIQDFVDAFINLIKLEDKFLTVNVASGNSVELLTVIEEVLTSSNHKKAKINLDLSKPTMIPKRLININYLKKLLDFEPKISLEEGIKKTMEWYMDNKLNRSL